MKNNIIAKAVLARRGLPATAKRYGCDSITLEATAKLEQIGGNAQPHFSVTGSIWKGTGPYTDRNDIAGGCIHGDIARVFPELAPLIALHLADADGTPMHAVENGFYWLAGTVPHAFGQQYHGGSGNGGRSPEECERILCEHLRITPDDVEPLRAAVVAAFETGARTVSTSEDVSPQTRKARGKAGAAAAKARFAQFCEEQKPRWQAEAAAGLALIHSLAATFDAQPEA